MDWLASLASSSGLGAALGLIGGIGQKIVDMRAKKLDYDFQLKSRNQDIAESKLDREHELSMAYKQMEIAEVEGEIENDGKRLDAFTESQKNAGRIPILTYVRAAITFYLLIAVSVLFYQAWSAIGGIESLSTDQLSRIVTYMIESAVFLATTCVTWWFAAQGGNMKGLFSK